MRLPLKRETGSQPGVKTTLLHGKDEGERAAEEAEGRGKAGGKEEALRSEGAVREGLSRRAQAGCALRSGRSREEAFRAERRVLSRS